ncbi:MAG: hypothetical protein P8016_16080 [Sedimentisphaerales bacterium]
MAFQKPQSFSQFVCVSKLDIAYVYVSVFLDKSEQDLERERSRLVMG